MPIWLLSPLFWKIAGAVALSALLVFGCNRRDAGLVESGRAECRAEATANAEASRLAAEKASRELTATHAKTEAALRRKVAALRSAQSDACSEAKMLPQILEALK